MNRKQKIIISVTGIFIVLLILVGLTYAYFLTNIRGNTNTKSIEVTTANLELIYGDGNGVITANSIVPISASEVKTKAIKKTFTVQNSSGSSMMYMNVLLTDIDISQNLKNEDFIWELYEITSSSSDIRPIDSGTFKEVDTTQRLTTTLIIENETKQYELYVYIKETGEIQNDMMNQSFSAKIDITGSDKLLWNDYPTIVNNPNMASQIFRNMGARPNTSNGSLEGTYINSSRIDGEIIYVLLKTNDTTGTLGSRLLIRQGSVSNRSKYVTQAVYQQNGYYLITYAYIEDPSAPIPYLLIDFRGSTSSIEIEYAYVGINYIPEDTNGYKVAYVAPDGNDTNIGITESEPLATFNTAIESGANIILIKPGDYQQSMISYANNVNNRKSKDLQIYSYENGSFSDEKVNIKGDTDITNLVLDSDNLLSKDYTSSISLIWQSTENIANNKKLVLSASKENCKTTPGTYYLDGSKLYINPYSESYTRFVTPSNYKIYFYQYNNLLLKNIDINYGTGIAVSDSNNVILLNCSSNYNSGPTISGIAFLRSNGKIYDSTATKNVLDGFNFHSTESEDEFIVNCYNCKGNYNYDDGISHHDNCGGDIIGGEFTHNIKGGVIPISTGQKISIKNLITEYNYYGVYIAADGNVSSIYDIYNVVSRNNTKGISIVDNPPYLQVNSYNLLLENNEINSEGTYNSQ